MGFLKRRPKHDEASIRSLLETAGASAEDAARIVELLGSRLTPDEMHVWLSHPERSHGVPDPEASDAFAKAGLVPVTMNWTPINAVSAGKTHLVVDEAERYAAGS